MNRNELSKKIGQSTKPVILCVDDEGIILVSLKEQLKHFFKDEVIIETAESGSEALEIINDFIEDGIEPPIVISDQIMPGMTGDELLTEVHKKFPKTNKILLTGLAVKEDIINAVNNANLYRFISKPWNDTDLNLTVREALNSYIQDKQILEQAENLKNANIELIKINKELDTFLYKSSHDLKGPVTTLKGLCNLGLLEKDFQYFEKEKPILDSMVLLLRKIMHVSQLRNMEVQTVSLDLEKLIINSLESIKSIVDVSDINIDLDMSVSTLNSDEEVVSNILYNIILNAVTYASFASRNEQKWVKINTAGTDNSTIIRVSNNGVTIPEDTHDRIYEMFYKANDINNGYGLGLYISKIAVENIGGTICHVSEKGNTTTFIVEIPNND